jgi:hypothetical protein
VNVSSHNFGFGLATILLAIGLFLGVLLCLQIGRRLGLRRIALYGKDGLTGVGKADAPVYALLALLMGFAFSGAAARFDHRRELIAQQVSAISTGWTRIDVLPPASQERVRTDFRSYTDALIQSYVNDHGFRAALVESPVVTRAREQLWSDAVAVTITADGDKARMLLLPSINEMFDVADTERFARWIHPPTLIYVMLGIMALASALFAGFGLASSPGQSWMYKIGIAATIAVALFATIELEYPRRGLVRVDQMDQALIELRATMK